ncbi:hypothetical protein LIA77_10481 [Sarocladium implicatum]|nr:hypothetical protein LIA77_10481 [Sarocladium implicatum]
MEVLTVESITSCPRISLVNIWKNIQTIQKASFDPHSLIQRHQGPFGIHRKCQAISCRPTSLPPLSPLPLRALGEVQSLRVACQEIQLSQRVIRASSCRRYGLTVGCGLLSSGSDGRGSLHSRGTSASDPSHQLMAIGFNS